MLTRMRGRYWVVLEQHDESAYGKSVALTSYAEHGQGRPKTVHLARLARCPRCVGARARMHEIPFASSNSVI